MCVLKEGRGLSHLVDVYICFIVIQSALQDEEPDNLP